MIAICITKIVVGLIAVVAMLYVLKVNFERKHTMLKLFQFGLVGVLVINLLNSLTIITEYSIGLHKPSTSDIYSYFVNVVICLLFIPYFLFAKDKKI